MNSTNWKRAIGLGLTTLVVGCSSDSKDPNPWQLNNDATTTSANNTTANNTSGTNNTIGPDCNGPSFECSMGCGGDYFMGSECVGGTWRCPEGGWVPIDDCPPGSCFGLPLPGEICSDGFMCDLVGTGAINQCPEFACATCRGFDAETDNSATCACECVGSEVRCKPVTTGCSIDFSSDLDGVDLRVLTDRCAWTREELEAGVVIGYEVTVAPTAEDTTVINRTQDAGGCGRPDDSGLIPFYRIASDQNDGYCSCDVGLCAPENAPSTLVAGTFTGEFEWFGRNWSGPSDTGNPMGEPFAASSAVVSVSAIGERPDGSQFKLESSMEIELLP